MAIVLPSGEKRIDEDRRRRGGSSARAARRRTFQIDDVAAQAGRGERASRPELKSRSCSVPCVARVADRSARAQLVDAQHRRRRPRSRRGGRPARRRRRTRHVPRPVRGSRTIFRVATFQTTVSGAVARRCDEPSVVAEGERVDDAERPAQLADDGLVARAPERHAVRRRRRREERAVGAHGDGRRRVLPPARRAPCAAAATRDRSGTACRAGGRRARPRRSRCRRSSPSTACAPSALKTGRSPPPAWPVERLAQRRASDVPDVDAAVVGRRREELAVGAEREREHLARRAAGHRPPCTCAQVDEL